MSEENGTVKIKKRRGFAVMSPELRSEIARKGGKAAHANGAAHQFTTEEAKAAGAKGGRTTAKRFHKKETPTDPAPPPTEGTT